MPTRAATQADMAAASVSDDVSALLSRNAVYTAAQNVRPGIVSGNLPADVPEAEATPAELKRAMAGAKKIVKDAKKAAAASQEAGEQPVNDAPVNDASKFTGKRANQEKQRQETRVQQEAASSAVDAALAKLQGVPELEPEPEVVEDDAEEVEDVEASEEPEETDEDEYERASAILRLDGWKSKALAKLSQQEVLELAASRSRIRAGVEERLNELAALKKTAAAATEKPRESATAQPATGAPSFDVKKATTRIREQRGDEEADMVGEAIQSVVQWAQGLIAEKESALQPLFAHVGKLTEAGARARLADVYPQVRKDKDWESVKKQVLKLNPVAFDHDVDAMFADAAEAKFGRAKQTNGVPRERVLAARARGQADVSSRTRDESPVTSDNKVERVYAALSRRDFAEAQRLGRS